MKSKGKFLVLTDMREAVGVEEMVGRTVIVNEDHIVRIDAVEKHIAEHLGYNATIHFVDSSIVETLETQEEIMSKLLG